MSRFHILGAGAVGRLFAAHLRKQGHDVTLLLRNDQKVALFKERAQGKIYITNTYDSRPDSGGKTWLADNVNAEALKSTSPISSLIVTTKAYDTPNALESVWSRLTRESVVVMLGNGMGVADTIMDRANQRSCQYIPSLVLATTSHGCLMPPPPSNNDGILYHTKHTGFGPTFVASEAIKSTLPNTVNVKKTTEALKSLPLDVQIVPPQDLQYYQLQKLAINSIINPVTVLLDCQNGKILHYPHGITLIRDLCNEISLVLSTSFPNLKSKFTPLILEQAVTKVCQNTRLNRSSMLQDISKGSPTEIDAINGYICKLAESAGIQAPLVKQLHNLVKIKQELVIIGNP